MRDQPFSKQTTLAEALQGRVVAVIVAVLLALTYLHARTPRQDHLVGGANLLWMSNKYQPCAISYCEQARLKMLQSWNCLALL